MIDDKKLDEVTISDIILCEPITSKGRESLTRLGLTTQDISPSYFFDKICVNSKYDESKEYKQEIHVQSDQDKLYYKYTVDYIQFEELKHRLARFKSRLNSNSPNEYPLLILGVAGNGKSIEVNRQIREITSGESEFECGRAYLDLEEAFTEITYGIEYICPEWTPLWFLCVKLLDGIMSYIRNCHLLCPQIFKRFNEIIVKENLASEKQILLFENIGNYRIGDNKRETAVFSSLIALLKSQQAEEDMRTLLKTLMWIMFCSNPEQKHYVIFDNIEQYIKLNASKIQIPNSDVSKIYKSVNNVVINIINTFNRIEKDLGWRAFKVIVVLRRTSLSLLDSTLLHSAVKAEQNVTDLTGYFQIPDIWMAKKKFVWTTLLCNKFSDRENGDIIKLIDFVMKDGVQAIGTDYQSIIAPLMSYGIRRNAKSQAHSIYETYKILSDRSKKTINQNEFYMLMSNASSFNNSIRYMFRRALIEFQFKWPMSNENQDRWRELGIGHLSGQRDYSYCGEKIKIEGVAYYDNGCVTLMRRILAFLSHFPDKNNSSANSQYKAVADMFSTLSLFDLIEGILVDPQGHKRGDFLQFSRVLIALGDMSNGDTKSAPYIILSIKDDTFHANPCDLVLAELLKKIWEDGRSESLPGGKYHSGDYGVRITDAGEAFLFDWQASFSFMASLYCFTIPPLFFLRDISSIKYVIKTVYDSSFELCKKYEEEATNFCGNNNNITIKRGTYLPIHNGKCVTFRQRVKELHINHLVLYREFIRQNYNFLSLTQSSMEELTWNEEGFITKFISKYEAWETGKGAPECF